jgi:beta-glucuronidase
MIYSCLKAFVLTLTFVIVSVAAGHAQFTIRTPHAIPLTGSWQFAIDPANVGRKAEWFSSKVEGGFDRVSVPHCYSTDPRFAYYTGTAWYRKRFVWMPQAGNRTLLHFDAVYYKSDVWLNGHHVGGHEGGYTPFHFDVTEFLREGENLLVVLVNNNTWEHGTIPGAKDHNLPNYALPGWLNFGGITRPVYLTVKPEIYTENLKIESSPDLSSGNATVKVKMRIRNASSRTYSSKPALMVRFKEQLVPLSWNLKTPSIPPGTTRIWEAETTMRTQDVRLWGLDTPHLYRLSTALEGDTLASNFGIRKIEISGTQLLLNGHPVKAAGGNRVIDYKKYGSLEPDWLIEQDFRLMKEAGMELHRLTHYTPSEYFYDLADKYGMLIITEVGNWQISPAQMDNDSIRLKFKNQFTEMAERDWNHPSVFAYSVGNEYLSEQAAGQRWTKYMIDFAKALDPTRLYTFATMRLNTLPERPEDEASQYVDFVCTNTYGGHAKSLDHIHQLYPNKPILISEWGMRSDTKGGEEAQARHIEEIVKIIRARPYVIGASWWSYNDYESRFQGTNPETGLRPWGIVGHKRELRPAYTVHQREMAVLTLVKKDFKFGAEGRHTLYITISVRDDFPSYPVEGYTLRVGTRTFDLPSLQPGQHTDIQIPLTGFADQVHVEVFKPTGFKVLEEEIRLD